MMKSITVSTAREFASDVGPVRIGADGQIVLGKVTVASSADAHAWADEHMRGSEKADLKRGTRWPGWVPVKELAR